MRRSVTAAAAVVMATLGACGGTEPLSHDKANRARDAVAVYARDHANASYTRGARSVVASRNCYPSDHHRIYCEVAFEDYAEDPDHWCVTGYTATSAGHDVRNVRVGDPDGPGWECGSWTKDGDPLA